MTLRGLGKAMKADRIRQGLKQADCVDRARSGISVPQWSKLENGHDGNYLDATFAAVDRGLQWAHGRAAELAAATDDDEESVNADPSAATSGDVAAVREVLAAVEALQAQLAGQAERERVLAREVERLRGLLEGPGTPQRLGARPVRRRRTD